MTLLRSGMWRLYFTMSSEGRKRYFDEVLPLLHDTKHEVLGERDADAWYLVFLGTKPNSQGRGYAQRLLGDVMKRVCFFLLHLSFPFSLSLSSPFSSLLVPTSPPPYTAPISFPRA
jgi:hypothetical protein